MTKYIIFVNYPFKAPPPQWNNALNKKLNLPAGGGKCYILICSNYRLIQEFSKPSLYEWAFE